jgi:hypothetical protein
MQANVETNMVLKSRIELVMRIVIGSHRIGLPKGIALQRKASLAAVIVEELTIFEHFG